MSTFNELVFDKLPDEKEIFKTLTIVADRLKTIEWEIKP